MGSRDSKYAKLENEQARQNQAFIEGEDTRQMVCVQRVCADNALCLCAFVCFAFFLSVLCCCSVCFYFLSCFPLMYLYISFFSR